MDEIKIQLILASASPRRKELLKGCFLNYQVRVSNIDENISFQSPHDLVEKLALGKATAICDKIEMAQSKANLLVLGADTIVVVDDQILEKPKDVNHAREMLQILSGKEHLVMTGVALILKDKSETHISSFVETTKVLFNPIESDLLELYLTTGESLDKAGAYGIQGVALSFINSIKGSYSNVVGLPVDKCLKEIKKIVGAEKDSTGEWREKFV